MLNRNYNPQSGRFGQEQPNGENERPAMGKGRPWRGFESGAIGHGAASANHRRRDVVLRKYFRRVRR